ncbi:linoleate 13S-lipoxygenase 2-1, chloroplastic-like [Tripterygium wilfordii]|uniref:linoleate 13S-lipoxygenase 2-1, chloroplastic-like n=1 Tax=Tripterygium wilfordii TaxID=458696 RepID=UPI0018F8461D|nr:linoleate 13S-lipoxygenase 2-1, chloroplastic-like [Tripterygium wilfordii]
MMNSQIQRLTTPKPYSLLGRPSSLTQIGFSTSVLPLQFQRQCNNYPQNQKKHAMRSTGSNNNGNVKALFTPSKTEKTVAVKGTITVTLPVIGGSFSINDLLGRSFLLELVSSELDPNTGEEKPTVKDYALKVSQSLTEAKFVCNFKVPVGFGEVGAIIVENQHLRELFFKEIVLQGLPDGSLTVTCESWVHSKHANPNDRVFFTNKSYLTDETPAGLKRLRAQELANLRGNGTGERKLTDRIYDYDKYNDLGYPDSSNPRPILGGQDLPYPRRCRTGRAPTKTDPNSEKRSLIMYVPRDESFSAVKTVGFGVNILSNVFNSLLPTLETALVDPSLGFPLFTHIDTLFDEGVNIPKPKDNPGFLKSVLPNLIDTVQNGVDDRVLFDTPEMMDRDKFSWFRDEEFSRQTLAGLNPLSIQLVTEWPLRSGLDPAIYGPAESAITTELIEKEIKGVMTVEEALQQKKLFILDYHDVFMPYVNKIRELDNTTMYASRTLFFLTEDSILRPVAIELVRPPSGDKPQWKQVFTPSFDATGCWLWRLAKAHVTAHDSGYHQLISHWLRTHCCVEPYIIASNRQLSAMHPIYRLLYPHFRYTMEINALARLQLINADGVIESTFSPGKYSMEISAVVYGQSWRFDTEALPADLIRRGMAVEDPTAKHGLKLTIEDYPYANDGLLLWDIIKEWVSDYVNQYYQDPSKVESDTELQAWWTEIKTKGHEDKKDESWWPVLNTPEDLIQILTTIIWVASGHHAAVNFGQYNFGGYFPNRPSITRKNMPTEDPTEEELRNFLKRPEDALLQSYPSQIQATKVMSVLNALSSHSTDEEYLGETPEPSWVANPVINAAYERFNARLKELEGIIDGRNADLALANRSGAGIVPYELLKPFSGTGVTGKGVPNSISI